MVVSDRRDGWWGNTELMKEDGRGSLTCGCARTGWQAREKVRAVAGVVRDRALVRTLEEICARELRE
jgi:hypothetical protein